MKIINITKEEFDKLKVFKPKNTSNREGVFFHYGNELIKSFTKNYNRDDYTLEKHLNLLTISNYEEILKKIETLLIPSGIVNINNDFLGNTIKNLKNSISSKKILQDTNIDFNTKLKILKQIGQTLENMNKIIKNAHLNDLHEDNILVTENHKIQIIDIDSMYFENNVWFPSKYIASSLGIYNYIEKYKTYESNIIPSKDTDIYCYTLIILNTISNFKINRLIPSEFFDYINYLRTINFPYEFLDCISKIYSLNENENPLPYLETLPTNKIHKANYLAYTKKTGKPIIYLK